MVANFGCGTGRCGSLSLAKSRGWEHEPYGRAITWGTGAEDIVEQLIVEGRSAVHPALLGYVPWIFKLSPESEVICLMRDKAETVDSFLRHRPEDYNPLDPECPRAWKGFGLAMPKYPGLDKRAAHERYWDDYYSLAYRFSEAYSNFRIVPTETLPTRERNP